MPNLLSCFLFTVTCQLAVFRLLSVCVLAGGGWRDWRVLCGLAWRGRLVCDCVWDVVMGDRHVDVWVLLDGACCEGWCARLLLLLRSCAVLMLSYNLDYG